MLFIRIFLIQSLIRVVTSSLCGLCGALSEIPRWDFLLQVDPVVLTCRDIYFDLAKLDSLDGNCINHKEKYQEPCCGKAEPDPADFPTFPPGKFPDDEPKGTEPDCPICGTLEYPGFPNALFGARYVGVYTCGDFFGRGLNGLIPDFMCGPLQDYAEPICGCGQYNLKCIEDPSQCWGSANSTPTTAPSTSSLKSDSLQSPTPLDSTSQISSPPTIFQSTDDPSTLTPSVALSNTFTPQPKRKDPTVAPTAQQVERPSTKYPSARPSNTISLQPQTRHYTPMPTVPHIDNIFCQNIGLKEIARECDCSEKKPGKPWKNEKEYIKCVKEYLKKNNCDMNDVLDSAGCLPFKDAISPTEASVPTLRPSGQLHPTCPNSEIERLASVCDCAGKTPGNQWKNEDQYRKCVKKRVKKSGCAMNAVLESAGCLPFPGTEKGKKSLRAGMP